MLASSETRASPGPKRAWRQMGGVVALVTSIGVLLALVFVPYDFVSQELQVSPGASATTSLTISEAGWVTVHFSQPSGMPMRYWMQDAGGMMFDHSMMGAGDSYSFWSWGGTYQCGAGYAATGAAATSVWVNASWGML